MKLKKTILAGLLGLAYISIYGFFTMFETGGGHGNFVWLMLLIFVNCFGLYFPLMAMIAVNLRSWTARIIYGCLLAANVIASIIMILAWISETSSTGPTDFERTMNAGGINEIIFSTAIHFLPSLVFFILLLRSLMKAKGLPDSDDVISLQLS